MKLYITDLSGREFYLLVILPNGFRHVIEITEDDFNALNTAGAYWAPFME